MKAIIDGKRYDTEKTTLIGEVSGGEGRGDLAWWEARLYVTPKGNFFLEGEGNAASRFAVRVSPNSHGPGRGIHPIDREEARCLAEGQLDVEQIERFFGDEIEDA